MNNSSAKFVSTPCGTRPVTPESEGFIDRSQFNILAQRIVNNKAHLEEAFADYPQERSIMMECITRLQKEWFAVLEAESGVITCEELAGKAMGKSMKLERRKKSKQVGQS